MWISFTKLPKYNTTTGNLITYTVAEDVVSDADTTKSAKYTSTIDQTTRVITNTFNPKNLPDTTPVVLTKVWLDNGNKYEIVKYKKIAVIKEVQKIFKGT